MLFDTDVWVWYLRGNAKAGREIEEAPQIHLSCVTYMELLQGVRNSRELAQLRETLEEKGAKMVYLDEATASQALLLMEQYCLSHSLKMGDALLAATALRHGWILCTANDKHYKMIQGLQMKKFRP